MDTLRVVKLTTLMILCMFDARQKIAIKNQDGPIYYRPHSSAGFAADDRFKPPLTASRFVLDEHKEVTSDHPPGFEAINDAF